MTLEHSSRFTHGHREVRSIPRAVAASRAPVVEPKRGESKAPRVTRVLSPEEASNIARTGKESRKKPAPTPPENQQIPSLPPAPHQPIRFAPIVFVLVEMLIDTVAIAGAFGLAYWLRFRSDIIPKF